LRVETLQDVLAGLARWSEAPAVISFQDNAKRTLSYRELDDLSQRLAAGLIARGVGPGEAIGLYADNRPEAVVARLALIGVGATLVSIDEDLRPEQLAHVIEDSGCRRLFTVGHDLSQVRACGVAGLDVVLLDRADSEAPGTDGWRSLLAGRPAQPQAVSSEAIAALFYTSGTTGPPKGVPLSHANIAANLNALLALDLVGPSDRVMLPLPLHHSYPFIVGMLTPLVAGAAMVMPSEVTGPAVRTALRDGAPTIMIGVPRLYETLYAGIEGRVAARGRLPLALFRGLLALSIGARRRFGLRLGRRLFVALHKEFAPCLRILASGGARLDPDMGRRLEGLGWQVLTGYGLVETASISTFNPPGRERMDSAGLPAPGVEIRIDQPDAEGRGEILIRGSNVFRGYHKNAEANRAAFTEGGWFRSGDLGMCDAEGYLKIVGRAKEAIVLPDGKNVAPEEVEAVYAASPYVRDVAVIEHKGSLAALVVPEVEALREAGSARVHDLIRVSLAELSQALPPYQRLSDFAVTRQELPRTHLGKFRRHRLPEIFGRAERGEGPPPAVPSEADRALLESPRVAPLWRWLERRFEGRALTLDTIPQLDLGIDSLAWVALGLDIDERLGIHLSEETLARAITLRDLLEEVRCQGEAGAATREGEGAARRRLLAQKERWLQPTGPWSMAVGRILHVTVRLAVGVFLRLRVEGLHQVPRSGPLIIAANHASDLDPFVVAAALSFDHLRETYWGGDLERAFSSGLRRYLARVVHLFPVDDRAPAASLEMGAAVLERGHVLMWFPEEWRSPTGELQRFLPGVARLARRAGAPVLPAYIDGTFEAMPRTRRLPRPAPVRVIFGAPIPVAELEARGHGESPEERVCTALRDAVAAVGSV
jgi:long-chain acyl-CoA synthetase